MTKSLVGTPAAADMKLAAAARENAKRRERARGGTSGRHRTLA